MASRKQKGNQKIIHQILFDIGKGDSRKILNDKPEWAENMRINKKLNPTYRHILWNDDTAMSFVRKYYPQYLGMIRSFPHKFYFVDFFRYLVLAKMGGIYIDMDVRMKRPLPKDIHTVIGNSYTKPQVNNNVIMLPDEYTKLLVQRAVDSYRDIKEENKFSKMPGRKLLYSLGAYMFRKFINDKGLKSQINFRKYFYDEEAGSWIDKDVGVIKGDFLTKTEKGKPK